MTSEQDKSTGDIREAISPLDANFLSLDTPNTQQAIASLFTLDRLPNESEILDRCKHAVQRFPRISQRVDPLSDRFWEVDPDFDLRNHIHYIHCPAITDLADLTAEAAKIFSSRFDFSRPLWSLNVISSSDPNDPTSTEGVHGVLFKIHHALADGLGAMQFFYGLCGLETTSASREQAEDARSGTGAVVRTVSGLSRYRSFLRLIRETLTPGARCALNGGNSAARSMAIAEFSLKELQLLKRKVGGSTNDLMLALTTRAVDRYHRHRGQSVRSLKALIPFNLRKLSARNTLGNQLSAVGVELPVSLSDIRLQLSAIHRTLAQIRESGSFGAYGIMGNLLGLVPRTLRNWLCNAAARQTNFICTNVPGPQKPIYFGGSKITGNYGMAALMKHHGVAFAYMSYVGRMFVTVVTDPKIVRDPWELIGYFREAVGELQVHAQENNSVSA